MHLEDKARQIIENECEDYFLGIGDLSNAEDPMIQSYKTLLDEYPTSISIGITMPFFNEESEDPKIFKSTNCQLKTITTKICDLLENEGYKSLSFPKAKTTPQTFLSLHVIAAEHSDLGKIKNNGLLITPEAGSGVNWGTVLTDAPIKIGGA